MGDVMRPALRLSLAGIPMAQRPAVTARGPREERERGDPGDEPGARHELVDVYLHTDGDRTRR